LNAAANISDLQTIQAAKVAMQGKPVIVIITASKPMVFNEFEAKVEVILLHFAVQDQAVLEILAGKEPSGLLPVQMPANMETVEQQCEDVPHDMKVHVDTEGHAYDFGYGLNWKGVIKDQRTAHYVKVASK
jgi:beta-glucosidase